MLFSEIKIIHFNIVSLYYCNITISYFPFLFFFYIKGLYKRQCLDIDTGDEHVTIDIAVDIACSIVNTLSSDYNLHVCSDVLFSFFLFNLAGATVSFVEEIHQFCKMRRHKVSCIIKHYFENYRPIPHCKLIQNMEVRGVVVCVFIQTVFGCRQICLVLSSIRDTRSLSSLVLYCHALQYRR